MDGKMEKSKAAVWLILVFIGIFTGLLFFAAYTFWIDPYFHYRYPRQEYQYPIDNQRYQNDGISRHWSYDTIITGTSMTENFKTSECDRIFGGRSIKVPFSGGGIKK